MTLEHEAPANDSGAPDAIAIIGIAGRFPGARDVDAFWRNICAGLSSVTRFTAEELEDSFTDEERAATNFIAARPILDDVDLFDADYFDMYPREAALTDPQHRVFLEIAVEALEDGGCDPARFEGAIGVFAGCSMSTYFLNNICATRETVEEFTSAYQLGMYPTLVGALGDTLATRVAYRLNLRGPAMTVQSACSTSLLAIAQACQSLLLYQSDLALAGGASITFPQKRGYQHLEGGMASQTGVCRPFDAQADGTIFGSGAAVVLLKRLDEAIADGDRIYAVIRAAAVNNDGADKVGFTAPSVEGQAACIMAAHLAAGVDARTIGYIEGHGTATPLGDPIEMEGLRKAFGATTSDRNFCALGSVKANIGHLDAAAGVSGLIKTALSLHHDTIPPLANYSAPNPRLNIETSPFFIADKVQPYPRTDEPRRAGVSAFGVGGTNVHVVLEEAPARAPRIVLPPRRVELLTLSAKGDASLAAMRVALADHLESTPELPLADVAYTLQVARRAHGKRVAIAAETRAEAITALRAAAPAPVKAADAAAPVIFMFPGQGAQYPGMGQGLYESEPLFRKIVDRGADILEPLLDLDIRKPLFNEADGGDDAPHPIRSTLLAQPSLFLIEYATARLFMSWGVRPAAMVGHSVGEFVAACVAGVLRFEDALALIAARGRLMQAQAPGAMLSIRAPEAEARALIGPDVDLAAINGPNLCVAAGPFAAIEALEQRLAAKDIAHRRLHTSHAFHSRMMDGLLEELTAEARKITYAAPSVPYASGLTGNWVNALEFADPSAWARHCRETVRFADALKTVCADKKPVLLELGPGKTLSMLAAQIVPKDKLAAIVNTLPDVSRAPRDVIAAADALGKIWCAGGDVRFDAFHTEHHRKTPLPTYRFDRKRHWIDPPPVARRAAPVGHSSQSQTPAAPIAASVAPAPTLIAPPATPTPPHSTHQSSGSSLMTPDQHKANIRDDIVRILEDLSGEQIADQDPGVTFLELGFDSLFLGQVAQALQSKFGVKLTFRQLLGDLPSVAALSDHLAVQVPVPANAPTTAPAPTAASAPQVAAAPAMTPVAVNTAPMPVTGADSSVVGLMQMQLAAMQSIIAQQVQMLQGGAVVAAPAPQLAQSPAPLQLAPPAASAPAQPTAAAPAPKDDEDTTPARFRMYRPGASAPRSDITNAQMALIDDLVKRLDSKTPNAKRQTQDNRAVLADPRTAAGFRLEWKELVYPIVSDRSKGSRIWDIDGNEYIDLVNGYGQTAFGHAPDFVIDAVSDQLHKGFAIGPQSPLAGEVARMIAHMIGMERVTFCNTGSEAVMAAMRVARAVTGRAKVVVFNNDYHGQFDEVLVRPGPKRGPPKAMPVAPGITNENVANMVVLPYGEQSSLDWIRENARDLAAVIVEPIQSRHPEIQPIEFLRALRAITADSETAFIFDEVVTGFRVHPGGVQALWNIRADLATYGKVVGGGMPVGILAGCARFMDALDGGQWRFGDASVPEVAPTFFAGTFVRHPLVLAAVHAVMKHLEAAGPALQEGLAARMRRLVSKINDDLARRDLSTRANHFSSWFYVSFSAEDPLGALFYPLVRSKGVNIQDGYPCFLTTTHTEEDCAKIAAVFAEALDELQNVGILPGAGASLAPALAPAAQSEPIEAPLTEPQTEVLMAAQGGDEASCAYNESVSLELKGDLNTEALKAAFGDVVARHQALRGVVKRGETKLIIKPHISVEIPDLDFTGETDPRQAFEDFLAADAHTAFDLYEGPLVRAHLIKLEPQTHVFVFTGHHIIVDGWSINIILNELSAFYTGRVTGAGTPALEPVEPFAAYAAREVATANTRAETEQFWMDMYKTTPPRVELPTDRPRPARKTFAGASYTDFIDAQLMKDVRKAGAKAGCTLFVTLFGALQAMFARFTGEGDIVIGSPSAGQANVPDKVLVGHCVNSLAIRAPLDLKASLAAHLAAIRAPLLSVFDHADFTFGELVRKLNLPRDPNRTPLTDLLFNLEKLGDNISFTGLEAHAVPNAKASVNFDVFFNMIESPAGLRIDVDYSKDIFESETIARWVDNLRTVLRAFVEDSARPIATMPLLGEKERAWLLGQNSLPTPLPGDTNIANTFARIAGQHGESVALACEEASLTYGALEARANRLARLIAKKGVAKGDRVALFAGRSIDTVTAMLAIVKCGALYVPLDPTYPAEQLNFILSDSQPRMALAQRALMKRDEPLLFGATEVLIVEDAIAAAEVESGAALQSLARADDGAYVLYTSGSTGRPKGVLLTHRGAVRLVSDADLARVTSQDSVLHIGPLAFDASAQEIWGALLNGAKLAIVTEHKPSAAAIANAISRHGVTLVATSTALFHALVDEILAAFAPVKHVIVGGDVLSPAHVRKVYDAYPNIVITNGYGPTENATCTTYHHAVRDEAGPYPIGRPIARSSVYVMDANGQLAARGAIGELVTGGEGVALGYLDRPELTAERFIADPFNPGGRLYRTGDLARWRGDGVLEFMGRADTQVKINGFRVELGEIESTLAEHKDVAQAAVVARASETGGKRLFAYVTRKQGSHTADDALIAALSDFANQRLPEHMQPRGIMVVDALPWTPSGKLDRNALPAFEARVTPLTTPAIELREVRAPQSDGEKKIAAIWRAVLGLAEVDRTAPIFSLGADSLHIFRIAARFADEGIPLEARHLMRNASVADLAALLAGGTATPAATALGAPSLASFRRGARRGAGPS